MKPKLTEVLLNEIEVAPHAGAWIETHLGLMTVPRRRVAPHAGAWIETIAIVPLVNITDVAPHAGAWIETLPHKAGRTGKPSRPTRARGLKPAILVSGFVSR